MNETELATFVEGVCGAVLRVNKTCGVHVHLGCPTDASLRSNWSNVHLQSFLGFGAVMEDSLYAICPPSRRESNYCKKLANHYNRLSIASPDPVGRVSSNKMDNPKRYCWLNLVETKRQGEGAPAQGTSLASPRMRCDSPRTVEIRMLGCCRHEHYILPWVKLWANLAFHIAVTNSAKDIVFTAVTGGYDSWLQPTRQAYEEITQRRLVIPSFDIVQKSITSTLP